MTVRTRRYGIIVVVATMSLLGSPASPTLGETSQICKRYPPDTVGAVRGFTWLGTVTQVHDGRLGEIVFDVDRVYANSSSHGYPPTDALVVGPSFRLDNHSCVPLRGLEVGQQYLVSAGNVGTDGPVTYASSAWLIQDDEANFVHMYSQERTLDPRLPAARTLQDVVDLVAPGDALPPTDTIPSAADTGPWRLLLTIILAVLAPVSGMLALARINLRKPIQH